MSPLKEWYTAAELAGMPGLPGTERRVRARADRENWQHRPRAARGGGREYHFSALPRATQDHLHRQHTFATMNARTRAEEVEAARRSGETFGAQEAARIEAAAAERWTKRQKGAAQWAALAAGPRKERAQARLWLLERLWESRRTHVGSKAATRAAFVLAANSGDFAVPAWVAPYFPQYEARRALTEHTLQRWEGLYEEHGTWGLVDRYGNRKAGSKIETNDTLKGVVLGCILSTPHITPPKIKQYIEARHPELDVVSAKGIERFVARWKRANAQVWTWMTNPDKWKNVYMPAHGSHFEAVTALNQLWELDSTPADWMLVDGRHSVLGTIDVYTRRLMFQVSRTSKASAVCALIRRAIQAWGVPDTNRTDNGQEYVSDQVSTALRDLGIRQDICLPFHSEDKAAIERAMQTMSHGILDLLPGFIGHNVAERKVIEARASFAKRVMTGGEIIDVKMTAAELQQKLDDWCEVYHTQSHSGLDGKSPLAMVAAWTKPIQRIADERALDALLAPLGGNRVITKKGIAYDNRWYISPTLAVHTGAEVQIKLDESALGRLYVYTLDGAFIAVAECPDLTGISRKEAAAAAQHHAKRFIAGQTDDLRKFKRGIKENIAEAVLTHQLEAARKLTHLPLRTESYTTPALDQAAIAARALDAPQADEPTSAERDAQAALERELANPPVTELPETDRQRYQRWVRLARRATQEPLTEAELDFLVGYAACAEWRAQHGVHVDFGLEVDGIPVTAQEKAPQSAGLNNNVEMSL